MKLVYLVNLPYCCTIQYSTYYSIRSQILQLASPVFYLQKNRTIHCFKFPQIFRQIDVVRRGTLANRRKYSGIFFRCICGYFPVYLRVFSGGFLSPTNFSHNRCEFSTKKNSSSRYECTIFGTRHPLLNT